MIRRWTRVAVSLASAVGVAALASCASPRGSHQVSAPEAASSASREHGRLRRVHGQHGRNVFSRARPTRDSDGCSQCGSGGQGRTEEGSYPLKVCVVSGENLGSMGEPVEIDYQGTRVLLCCQGCAEKFQAEPEKYVTPLRPAGSDAPAIPAPAGATRPAGGGLASEPGPGTEAAPIVGASAEAEPATCHSAEGTESVPAAGGLLVDLELGLCPVQGEWANGKTYAEWKGVRVGLCSPECLPVFQASAEAYLDAVAPEWKEAVAAEQVVLAAKTQEDRELAMEDLARWTIVRKLPPIPSTGLLVDLANDYCPVLLEEIHGRSFVDWNGLRVHLCCAACVSGFWPHPGLVLEHAKIEWREAASAVKAVNESRGADREKALLKLRSEWKMLREPEPPSEVAASPSK